MTHKDTSRPFYLPSRNSRLNDIWPFIGMLVFYLVLSILIVLVTSLSAHAQFSGTATAIRPVSVLPTTCNPMLGQAVFLTTTKTNYSCTATNVWTAVGAGFGLYTAPFAAVASFTVTQATHLKGTSPVVEKCENAATPKASLAFSYTTAANGDVVITLTGGSATGNCFISDGKGGIPGTTGTSGAAASIAAGTTTTGAPGSSASVANSGSSAAAIFDFTVPQGTVGLTGASGTNGLDAGSCDITMSGAQRTVTQGSSCNSANPTHGLSGISDLSCLDGSGSKTTVPWSKSGTTIIIAAFSGTCTLLGSGNSTGSGTALTYTTYQISASGSNMVVSGGSSSSAALAAATTQDVTLFTMPAGGYMCGYVVKLDTSFTGTSFSAATVSVGGVSPFTDYISAFNIFQAAGPAVKTSGATLFSTTEASHVVKARLTSTGGNWSAATGGLVEITTCTLNRPILNYSTLYSYKKAITIPSGTVSGDITNQDIHIKFVADADMGAHIMDSTNCADLVFASDASGNTPLNYEKESCTDSGGLVTWKGWVQSNLATASTNTLYAFYGRSSITTNQSPASAWESAYKAVYHYGNGALGLTDSTTNAANLTNHSATATTGLVNNAALFATTAYLSNATAVVTTMPVTFITTAKLTSATLADNEENVFQAVGKTAGLSQLWTGIFKDISDHRTFFRGVVLDTGGGVYDFRKEITTPDTNPHCYAAVFNTFSSIDLYIDGTLQTGAAFASSASAAPVGMTDTYISSFLFNGASTNGDGNHYLDESRFYNGALSAARIKADCDTILTPGSFFSVGPETAAH